MPQSLINYNQLGPKLPQIQIKCLKGILENENYQSIVIKIIEPL